VLPPLEELELLDEELELEDELLEEPELLELEEEELLELDELLEEELLELVEEEVLELLDPELELPPPQAASARAVVAIRAARMADTKFPQ
jgi:hypothetical protein